ncbi:hypothetical protein D3C87_2182040 [compost metagenome]
MTMLNIDVKVGQELELPGVGKIVVQEKSGRVVKLGFDMPGQVVRRAPSEETAAIEPEKR